MYDNFLTTTPRWPTEMAEGSSAPPTITSVTQKLSSNPFRRSNRSEVSIVIKYIVFGFNVVFWLAGCVLIGVGVWAAVQKDTSGNTYSLSSNTLLNPVMLVILAGCVTFVIAFLGWFGALRENTYLLLAYIVLVGLAILLLLIAAIILFGCGSWLQNQILNASLTNILPQYRDDPDLQDLIDWVQADWLQCCGLDAFTDWGVNMYFNCSSPGVEACGVPYSCCLPDPNSAIVNTQCGYGAMLLTTDSSSIIYITGCLEAGSTWFQKYIIPIAGITVGLAVVQILGICFAWNLRGDINAQKKKWTKSHA